MEETEHQESAMKRRASQNEVGRNLYWIWFAGAAVWFFDAAWGLHRGALSIGVLDAAVSAVFLAAGMYFRRQAQRQNERDRRRGEDRE